MWALLLQLSFYFCLHGVSFSSILSLSVCICPWNWSGSLEDSIYMDLVFCIHSASLCLLVGVFSVFTFKIIIDMYVLIAILLIVGLLFFPLVLSFFLSFSFSFFFFPFRAAPVTYGSSQARGWVRAAAYTRSELCLQPTPQFMAMPDP